MPERPQGSWLLRMFLLGLLGVGGYGGFYGYCKYQLSEIEWQFSQTHQDLRMSIMRKTTNIRKDDVKAVVRAMAQKHGLTVQQLRIVMEPLTTANLPKLPLLLRETVSRHASTPLSHKPPPEAGMDHLMAKSKKEIYYLVGFSGTFGAKYKVAKGTFAARRYTYFKDDLIADKTP